MAEKKEMSPKTKKIINIVVDVVCAIVLVLALFFAVCTISSRTKGYDQYTEVFGKAYLAVESNSMNGDEKDSFKKGDLITIKTLSGDEAKKLEVGDIISFKTNRISTSDKWVLNTHRIVKVNTENGVVVSYTTKGDANTNEDSLPVKVEDVVGVYQGKASGIGHIMLFMSTSAGFFVCVVLPTLLIVVYCAVNLALVIIKEKKAQKAIAEQAQNEVMEEERERIRQELLAEMRAQAPPAEGAPSAEDAPPVEEKPVENAEGATAEEEAPQTKDEEK